MLFSLAKDIFVLTLGIPCSFSYSVNKKYDPYLESLDSPDLRVRVEDHGGLEAEDPVAPAGGGGGRGHPQHGLGHGGVAGLEGSGEDLRGIKHFSYSTVAMND